jgi:predicted MFS family arabinose efflux permease
MMARLATARGLAPLRHPRFRLLMAGQLTSNVGDACSAVALAWYVLALHGGAALLGTVLAAYGIPRTALLLVGGAASDRWRPWTVMMVTDAARAFAAAGLAVAAGLGPARAAVLVPIAAVLGAGEGMFIPASLTIVPALLPAEELQAGNAMTEGGIQLATLAGPALGGALVALAGPAPAFWVDAASFAASALTLAGVRAAGRTGAGTGRAGQADAVARQPGAAAGQPGSASTPPSPSPSPVSSPDRENGLPASPAAPRTVPQLLRAERILQVAILVVVAANLGTGGAMQVALPVLAHGPLGSGAAGYGALVAAFGAGALVGTLVAGQLRQPRRPFVAASVAFLAAAACFALVPLAGSTILTATALLAFGVVNGFGNLLAITAFQRWAPPHMLGRLGSVLALASIGVFPLSVVLAGFIVRAAGPASFFWFAAITLAIAIGAGLTQRSWRDFGAVGTAPAGGSPAGAADLAAAGHSGEQQRQHR